MGGVTEVNTFTKDVSLLFGQYDYDGCAANSAGDRAVSEVLVQTYTKFPSVADEFVPLEICTPRNLQEDSGWRCGGVCWRGAKSRCGGNWSKQTVSGGTSFWCSTETKFERVHVRRCVRLR